MSKYPFEYWVIEEMIREAAYYKWQQAGSPDNMDIQFWLDAEKEVLISMNLSNNRIYYGPYE